jgi:ATP-dependent Lon protease
MEVIRFDGYTVDEKSQSPVATSGRASASGRLREDEVSIDASTLHVIVSQYTREAGVRQLERELGKLLRKVATTVASGTAEPPISIDEPRCATLSAPALLPGVGRADRGARRATGLAVTGTGGDVLFVEATAMPRQGRARLTGQLGDVMKESARIALLRAVARDELGIATTDFEDTSFHVHVPRERSRRTARAPASR